MNNTISLESFRPNEPDAAGVLSWVHIGDLHMREAGQQNDLDLQAIVDEVNVAFAGSVSFALLPGDNADHGNTQAYAVVRQSLDRLLVPWCAIVGDHDVEEKSFGNFRAALAEQIYYAFTAGKVRFLALNAFDRPDPRSFVVSPGQARWIEAQLKNAAEQKQSTVLLLHCYPSDLKEGGRELAQLTSEHGVKLVDMGHTHYNEISHDGRTIYTATRSTGQIEEGPVGFSVTNLDDGFVSWRFFELGQLPAVMITSPADERLIADRAELDSSGPQQLRVRAKVWGKAEIVSADATFEGQTISMRPVPRSRVWEATLRTVGTAVGIYPLRVAVRDAEGMSAEDAIQVLLGTDRQSRKRAERDQDNALEPWPEHGLLGTQLGPNKNGRKW